VVSEMLPCPSTGSMRSHQGRTGPENAASSKQGTYGAIGLAAAILLGLYFITRLVVATAVVNATLWERRNSSVV
jgi:hypothetical protein